MHYQNYWENRAEEDLAKLGGYSDIQFKSEVSSSISSLIIHTNDWGILHFVSWETASIYLAGLVRGYEWGKK